MLAGVVEAQERPKSKENHCTAHGQRHYMCWTNMSSRMAHFSMRNSQRRWEKNSTFSRHNH